MTQHSPHRLLDLYEVLDAVIATCYRIFLQKMLTTQVDNDEGHSDKKKA